jgi:hypothetical protein
LTSSKSFGAASRIAATAEEQAASRPGSAGVARAYACRGGDRCAAEVALEGVVWDGRAEGLRRCEVEDVQLSQVEERADLPHAEQVPDASEQPEEHHPSA